MLFAPEIHGQLARERIEREIATTELLRRSTQPSRSLRMAIGHRFMPLKNRVFLWRTIIGQRLPSESFARGLTHGQGTLAECVNFAALLGWKQIVLVGIDLYDRRYFWLPKDQPREMNDSVEVVHSTAINGLVELMRDWRAFYQARGIALYVYNRRSLLAGVMPVWPAARTSAP